MDNLIPVMANYTGILVFFTVLFFTIHRTLQGWLLIPALMLGEFIYILTFHNALFISEPLSVALKRTVFMGAGLSVVAGLVTGAKALGRPIRAKA